MAALGVCHELLDSKHLPQVFVSFCKQLTQQISMDSFSSASLLYLQSLKHCVLKRGGTKKKGFQLLGGRESTTKKYKVPRGQKGGESRFSIFAVPWLMRGADHGGWGAEEVPQRGPSPDSGGNRLESVIYRLRRSDWELLYLLDPRSKYTHLARVQGAFLREDSQDKETGPPARKHWSHETRPDLILF